MSNLDNIIDKIQAEADEKIAKINREARENEVNVKLEIINKANLEKEKIISAAKIKADTIYSRISENAEIRIRDQRLKERQNLIDRVFDLALKKLNSMSDSDYINQIKSVLTKLDNKDLELIVPKSRLEAVKKANLAVKLDEENYVENGFVLSSERMNYNFKYEDLINDSREEIGPDLIKFLQE